MLARETASLLVVSVLCLCHGTAQAVMGPSPSAATPSTVSMPDGPVSVGGLPVDPSVNHAMGAVEYGIPFDLPLSHETVGPRVGLHYLATRGNGAAGIAWDVPVAVVRRSTRLGVPGYDTNDTFEVDGLEGVSGRLFDLPNGRFGIAGNGSRVQLWRENGHWVARGPSGNTYTFGDSASARVEAGEDDDTKVAAWYVTRAEDLAGRCVGWEYSRESGRVYLARIVWGADEKYEAAFEYEARPDQTLSYRTGFLVETRLRLANAQIRAYDEAVRTYVLGYTMERGLSQLETVSVRGRYGESLPDVKLGYVTPTPQGPFAVDGLDDWSLLSRNTTLVDVDNDGVQDIVRIDYDDVLYKANKGGAFGSEGHLGWAWLPPFKTGRLRIMDFDGDTKPELLYNNGAEKLFVYEFNPDEEMIGVLLDVPVGTRLTDQSHGIWGDINGDGRPDYVEPYFGVYFGNDAGLSTVRRQPHMLPSGVPYYDESQVRLVDANGDDLADFVWTSVGHLTVYHGRGDGSFEFGVEFEIPAEAQTREYRFADFNRDGLLDVLHATAMEVVLFAARGDGTFSETARVETPSEVPWEHYVDVVDVNGNGSLDVLWAAQGVAWGYDFAGGSAVGLLSSIDAGQGMTIAIAYESSSTRALKDAEEGTPWNRSLHTVLPVVSEVHTDVSGETVTRKSEIRVRDGYWDPEERVFAGFEEVTEVRKGATDDKTEIVTQRFALGESASTRPLRGKARWERIGTGTGTIAREVDRLWNTMLPEGSTEGRLGVPILVETVERVYEGEETPVEVFSSYSHDAHGYVASELNEGRTDILGDERDVIWTRAHNEETGVLGVVTEEAVRDGVGELVSWTRKYYDGEEDALDLGEVERGWLRRVERYLEEEDRWVTSVERDLDEWGNPVWHAEGGITREYQYSEDGLWLTEERVVLDESKYLTWDADWDTVQGKLVFISDPNGDATHVGYDGLGRIKSIAKGSGESVAEPHVAYDYNPEGPRPRFQETKTDAGGHAETVVSVFNGAQQLLYEASPIGEDAWLIANWTEYDERGRSATVAEPFRWIGTDLPDALPESAATGTTAYDSHGRIVSAVSARGRNESTTYGQFEATVEASGLPSERRVSDGLGRVVLVERIADAQSASIEAEYGKGDQITRLVLNNGSVEHKYTWDTLGRQTSSWTPETGLRSFKWNDAGLLVSITNGLEETQQFVYDPAGRLEESVTSSLSGEQQTRRFHYDEPFPFEELAANQRVRGRLSWAEGPGDIGVFGYDAFGRESYRRRAVERTPGSLSACLSAQELPTLSVGDCEGVVVGWESTLYSVQGRILERQFDDGVLFSYRYDSAGRLNAVDGLWEVVEWTERGDPQVVQFGNGVQQTYGRDAGGLPTGTTLTSGEESLLSLEYPRNAAGWVRDVVDSDGRGLDHSTDIDYDGWGRLSQTRGAYVSADYAYDNLENLTARTVFGPNAPGNVDSGAYDYATGTCKARQLATTPERSITYDAAGRVETIGNRQLLFDGADRLLSVSRDDGPVASYVYGFDGAKAVSGYSDGTQEVDFFPGYRLTVEGAREHLIRVGGRAVARVITSHDGDGVTQDRRFLHRGYGAFPSLVTDEAGRVYTERLFEAFGGLAIGDYSKERLGAGDEAIDPHTGYAYHSSRWYSYEIGRWLSGDLLYVDDPAACMSNPAEANPYGFAMNNPISFVDPTGTCAGPITNKVCTAIARAVQQKISDTWQSYQSWRDSTADKMDAAVYGVSVDEARSTYRPLRHKAIDQIVAADAVVSAGGLLNQAAKGVSGARLLDVFDWDGAEAVYAAIRQADDVGAIAKHTGMNQFQVSRVKDHLFNKAHLLDDGVRRFDADPMIANAWTRLQSGAHTADDVKLLRHELFESKFEGIFHVDYRTAHNAANRAGHPSGLE